ncbi:MAG: hypothetical protein ACOC5T_08225 [Elusimicrobiota bacterium]
MKKVIIILGTSYSGSTLINKILGNRPDAISLGECYAFWRKNKDSYTCGCGKNNNCEFWEKMRKLPEKDLYSEVFKETNVDYIIDSSKRVEWAKDQIKYSKGKDYEVSLILIYKNPLNAMVSFRKRDKDKIEIYFRYMKEALDIKQKKLSVAAFGLFNYPKKVTRRICQQLGIEYIEDQEKFWTSKTDHSAYGNIIEDKKYKYDEKWKEYNDCMVDWV